MNGLHAEAQGAFRALADPTRRQILMHLSAQEMSIGEVTDRFSMTRAAIKKHLNILEEGHLISVHVNGRERINRLEPVGLKSASDWLGYFDQFWDDKLGALGAAIQAHEKQKKDKKND